MSLLIIGATGTLGRQIVRQALNGGYNVRCLVRNIRKANFLREWGAEIVYGDLTIPESIPECFKGITVVIDASTGRSTDNLNIKDIDWEGKIALIQAAKLAKIKRFIFFSILNSQRYNYIPLMKLKSKFELVLKDSGVPYTIFQLSGFFQGLIGQYALPILEQQPIYIVNETKTMPIAYMDTEDIAKFCLKSLNLKETENNFFLLGNPYSIKSNEIIKICETLSGQRAISNKLPVISIKLSRQFTSFFQGTWNIADRLSFIEIFSGQEKFTINYELLEPIFKIKRTELLTLDKYFQQYFERILTKLKDLNYDQQNVKIIKQKDLTF